MDRCDDVGPAVALFRSLADPARLALVQRLAEGEARVVDLTRALGLAQSTVSKHLACLRGCGLVDYRVQGRQSFYSLARPELIDLLRSAELVLAETGAAVALCPVYGEPAVGRGVGVVTAGGAVDRRVVLRRRIRLLVAATITYNVIEAVVAIAAGTVAWSVALIGFGLDSVIEVTSAAAVAWQFAAADPERRERTALRVVAVLVLRAGRLRDRRGRPDLDGRRRAGPVDRRDRAGGGERGW